MAFWHTHQADFIGYKAGADLSLSQHRAVEFDGNGDMVRANAGDSLGILSNNPKAGEEASVMYREGAVGPAVTGGTYARDAKLVSDANGRLVAVAPGAGVSLAYQYRALEASTAADQIKTVKRECGVLIG